MDDGAPQKNQAADGKPKGKKGKNKKGGKKKKEEPEVAAVEPAAVVEKEEEKEEPATKAAPPEISLAPEEERDVKQLFDQRLPPKEEPAAAGGGWGWSSWVPSVESITQVMDSVVAETQNVVGDAVTSVVNETTSVMGDMEGFVNSTLQSASSFAAQVETALGLEEDRQGFARFYVEQGGPQLTLDLKELNGRASLAVSSLGLSEEAVEQIKQECSAYRSQQLALDDEEEAAITEVPGVDVSSLEEGVKTHNLILVEAHQKLLKSLKECKDDDAVAKTSIESKNRMHGLFATGMFNLLQRAFLIIGTEADKLLELSDAAAQALETGEAEAAAAEDFTDLSKSLDTLKVLRQYLRQKLWKFHSDYAAMVKALPEMMEDVSESQELIEAMTQLTKATEAEITIDTDTALTIVDNCFQLLDAVLILVKATKK